MTAIPADFYVRTYDSLAENDHTYFTPTTDFIRENIYSCDNTSRVFMVFPNIDNNGTEINDQAAAIRDLSFYEVTSDTNNYAYLSSGKLIVNNYTTGQASAYSINCSDDAWVNAGYTPSSVEDFKSQVCTKIKRVTETNSDQYIATKDTWDVLVFLNQATHPDDTSYEHFVIYYMGNDPLKHEIVTKPAGG